MNEQADTLDQTDQEILTSTVSDEALEAAGGALAGGRPTAPSFTGWCLPCNPGRHLRRPSLNAVS